MSNYVPGGQKKSKAFKKCEREIIHAISSNSSEEKLLKLAEKLRESKIQAISVSPSPANLALEEALKRKDLLVQKWKSYSVEDILSTYR
ncbi:MAG: hypothetical protein FJ190_08315 [Gammaproteobacteria bacterium]|nr:hypothetical protein [Gammaproteobacteria bacterium]